MPGGQGTEVNFRIAINAISGVAPTNLIYAQVNNFQNPITFLCGAIQAASRMNAEQSAKLCVQYLAPIIKNRQYNFLPIGANPVVGAIARPNEVTYSEDWMRPDYVPPQPPPDATQPPLAAEATTPAQPMPTDPSTGLTGMMVPAGGGQ